MKLSLDAKKVLEVIADAYEKNPQTRIEGIHERIVGAKAGLYLNLTLYEVAELEDAGLIRQLPGKRIILTQKGYNYARPLARRLLILIKKHPVITTVSIISIVVTVIGTVVGIINLLR